MAIGDSITEGYNKSDGKKVFFFFEKKRLPKDDVSYPIFLQEILNKKYNDKKFEVVNYGIGGCTALYESDKPYVNQRFF